MKGYGRAGPIESCFRRAWKTVVTNAYNHACPPTIVSQYMQGSSQIVFAKRSCGGATPAAAPTGNSGCDEVAVIPVELSERTDSHTPPDVEAPCCELPRLHCPTCNTHSPLDIGRITCFCTRITKTKRAREKGSRLTHQDDTDKMATYVIVCTHNNTEKEERHEHSVNK